MYVVTYSLAKHGEEKLSENFRVREFRCNDGSDAIKICQETVNKLQAARDYFGKPVHINSAYRTPAYNASPAVNGAPKSQHVVGTACDIRIDGVPPKAVASFFEAKYPNSGIGLYGTFVHIDSRGSKSYWDQRSGKQVVVSSFKLGKLYEDYKAVTPTVKPTPVPVTPKEETVMDTGSTWSEKERAWAKDNGIIKGDTNGDMRWKGMVTREEMAVMLYRFYEKFVK